MNPTISHSCNSGEKHNYSYFYRWVSVEICYREGEVEISSSSYNLSITK